MAHEQGAYASQIVLPGENRLKPAEVATVGVCSQMELRHRHFAEATSRIANMMDDFKAKNRAATYRGGGNNDAMDMRAMRQLVQGLPQYRCANLTCLGTMWLALTQLQRCHWFKGQLSLLVKGSHTELEACQPAGCPSLLFLLLGSSWSSNPCHFC